MANKFSPDDFIDHDALEKGTHPADEFIDNSQAEALKKYLHTPVTPAGEAAVTGLSAAATEGIGSRLGALIGTGLEAVAGNAAMESPEGRIPLIPGTEGKQTLSELYDEYKKFNEKRMKKASEDQPWAYGAAQVAGGLALPWSKLTGASKLQKGASVAEKLYEGGKMGTKMGGIIGAANSPDYTDIPKTLESTGLGMAVGAPLGVGTSAIEQLLIGGAKTAGTGARSMVGPVGERFQQGQEAFKAGEASLATQEGLESAKANASKPVKSLLNELQYILKEGIKNKAKGVEEAGEKYGPLAQEKVDKFYSNAIDEIQTALEGTKDQKTIDELMNLLEKFTSAKEGRLEPVTTRVYAPGKKPPVTPAGPQPRSPEVMPMEQPPVPETLPPEVGQVKPQAVPQLSQGAPPQNLPQVREPGQMTVPPVFEKGQAIGIETAETTPSNFGGYKKVMATTINKDDEKALQAFHQKVREKEAEEAALPGQVDNEPIEVVPQEIEGYPDKIRLVARRKIIQEQPDEFADQAAGLVEKQKQQAKEQKEAQRLQEMLDRLNQEAHDEALKQQAAEAAKPYFEDITQMERTGGQDIYDPKHMASLQQDIQDVTPRFGDRGYQQTPSGNLATRFSQQARDIVTQHSPDISNANTQINATKNIFESLGLNADKLIQGGGEGQAEFTRDLNKLYDLFKPETNTPQSLVDSILTPDKMQYIQEQLQRVNPDLAERFAQTADKQKAMLELIRDFQKPYAGWSLKSILNAARTFGSRTAYQAGYALEREKAGIKKITEPMVNAGKKIYTQFTPEALKAASSKAAQDSNPVSQDFSRLLSKLADADDRTKNAMLFVLQQNVGYRSLMDRYLPEEPKKSTEAKDKTLEKFK